MLGDLKDEVDEPRATWKPRGAQLAGSLGTTLVPTRRKWCPGRDLNPHSACAKKDFKSFASADFATRAKDEIKQLIAGYQTSDSPATQALATRLAAELVCSPDTCRRSRPGHDLDLSGSYVLCQKPRMDHTEGSVITERQCLIQRLPTGRGSLPINLRERIPG